MTLVLELKPEIEKALRKKALANGKDFQYYVMETLERQALKPSLDEILAPVRQDFEESGMSEDDLNVFIDDLREKVWQEKQQK